MSNEQFPTQFEETESVDAIIDDMVETIECQGLSGHHAWLARHPQHAAELNTFFNDHRQVSQELDRTESWTPDELRPTESFDQRATRRPQALPDFQRGKTGLSKRWKMPRVAGDAASQPGKNRRDWEREIFSLLALGQYEAAERRATAAIRIEPAFHGHWLNRGKALAELQRYEAAQRCYAEAARLDPSDVQCWFNLAYALVVQGRAAEGLKVAMRALQVDPDSSSAWDALAMCQQELYGPESALNSFRNSVEANEDNWRAVVNFGACLNQVEQPDGALRWLNHAIELNPNRFEAWHELASAHFLLRNYSEARAAIDRSIRLCSGRPHPKCLNLRAVILWQLPTGCKTANLREAIRCLNEITPGEADAEFRRNLVHTIERDLKALGSHSQ